MVKGELVDKMLTIVRKSDKVITLVIPYGKVMVRKLSAAVPKKQRKKGKFKFYDFVSECFVKQGQVSL